MARAIFVADDSALVRKSLRAHFEAADFFVCGEAEDGVDAVQKAPATNPDLILLDLSMPRMNGLDAATALHEVLPLIPIVLFTMYGDPPLRDLAESAGITKVVSKSEPVAQLLSTVQAIMTPPP
jgi:DNA-binding NarL/FixJ family response regulator